MKKFFNWGIDFRMNFIMAEIAYLPENIVVKRSGSFTKIIRT
ncbi:MAG: hypothetical protein ACK5DE_02990 [Bacteroidota bacterium]